MKMPPTLTDFYPMKGGLDLMTPAIALKPGVCFDSQNFAPESSGGYRRIQGIERYDGHTKPSSATYWYMTYTLTGAVAVGNTVTGGTSGATAKVLAVLTGALVLGRVSGTFQLAESLKVGGTTQGTSTSIAVQFGASSPSDDADYMLLAANDRRADISAVPGVGPVRGVWVYADTVYAFRDSGTASDMYKATASGWSKISFGYELPFNNAVGQINVGDTITQSSTTAVVKAALLRSGTWTSAGTGTLVLASVSGAPFGAGSIAVGGVTKVTATGASAAITRAQGGMLEFVNANFTGSTSTTKMYGCDGVNPAFEFDGTNYVPIRTGMTSDAPTHIAFHKYYLFLSFLGSIQISGLGNPYSWSLLTGAAEIGVGEPITGFMVQTGNSSGSALAVYTTGKTYILYGQTTASFQLVPSVWDLGGYAYTMQPVGNTTYALTARGIQALITTLNYGDFEYAAVSFHIQTLVAAKRGLQTCSTTSQKRNEYRLYFNDGSGIVVGLTGSKVAGLMPINYGLRVVRCSVTATLTTGEEVTYFGSNDGFVYQEAVGTSFDGDPIEAWIRPAFNNLQSPRVRKAFRGAVFEVKPDGYAQVNITYELGYSTPDTSSSAVQPDTTLYGAGGYWDQFTWDQFTWDVAVVQTPWLSIDGCEKNIGFLFYSNRAQDQSYVIQGVTLMYTPRALQRS